MKKNWFRRFLAGFLAVAMIFTNLSLTNVYAEDGEETRATENILETDYEEEGIMVLSDNGTTFSHDKINAFDFGAAVLDESQYNNIITADVINSWYEGVEGGTTGKNIASFAVKDSDGKVLLAFNDGGYATTHRLRSTNTAITRYDNKELKESADATEAAFKGYIYSNKGKTDAVNLSLSLEKGDIVTLFAASNGTDSEIVFAAEDGRKQSKVHSLGGSVAGKYTFYAASEGTYKIYSATEKLVVARILVEHCPSVPVNGSVTAPLGLENFSLVFTNEATGSFTVASVSDGQYSVELPSKYTYTVSLSDANGYIVTEGERITLGTESASHNVTVLGVSLVTVSGELMGDMTDDAFKKATISLKPANPEYTYVPSIEWSGRNFSAKLEKGVNYNVIVDGADDYESQINEMCADEDGLLDFCITLKDKWAVTVEPVGASLSDLSEAEFTFVRHSDADVTKEEAASYTFKGTEGIELRNGVYTVKVKTNGFTQKLTSNLVINGEATTKTIAFIAKETEETDKPLITEDVKLTVGSKDCDYTTVNAALSAVRKMNRAENQRVTIEIQPGNYEEMLVIDVPNVSLVNAVKNASIKPVNKGVDIEASSVRITSYYGHGYTYYSMNSDCKYDEELLAVNKENGYASMINPGSGTTSNSYWNATVTVKANGFVSEGIIFENSFNQYVSKKAANDVIVKLSSAKEGDVARSTMKAGDTTVQNKKYVERAAALAIANNVSKASFDNCAFIGRQDTLYGGTNTTAAFYACDIYGGTDYIFGGMTAVFAKCNLVANTMEDSNDLFYITAPQQKSGRGYLMYNCNVVSTEPGVNTASEAVSKAGDWGRPWEANTSEVVFYATNVSETSEAGVSLIRPAGWNATLSSTSDNVYEFGTNEMSGADNLSKRVDWAHTYASWEDATLKDGTKVSVEAFFGEWDAFAGKDMSIVVADKIEHPVVTPGEDGNVVSTTYTLDASADLTPFAAGAKADGDEQKAGTDNYFTAIYSAKSKVDSSSKTFDDGYASGQRINFGGLASADKNAIKFTTTSKNASVKIWWVEGGKDNRQMAILDKSGNLVTKTDVTLAQNAVCISTLTVPDEGTYYLGGLTNNNYIFKVQVTEKKLEAGGGTVVVPERKAWSEVAAPVIASAVQKDGALVVTVNTVIGNEGADKLTVSVLDAEKKIVETRNSSKEGESVEFSITLADSGKYYVVATALREDEEASHVSDEVTTDFLLPLSAPLVKAATNVGDGKVDVSWDSVKEATGYILLADGKEVANTNELKTTVDMSEYVGKKVKLSMQAVRGEEKSSTGKEFSVTVKNISEREWGFTAYGSSTTGDKDGFNGSVNDGAVSIYSKGNGGKIVPNSSDGLAFYYTVIDPETENFTLEADVTVNTWTFTNGQEGFGLMVADSIGKNGDSTTHWNNSIMNIASKVEYVSDIDKSSKITMKLGVGALVRLGVTNEDFTTFKKTGSFAKGATLPAGFTTNTYTLERSGEKLGAGTYNIIGNCTNTPSGTISELTTLHMSIQRNNTGYILKYTDATGNVIGEQLVYDIERTALTQIDDKNIYLGFFASRNAEITVTNVKLTTINPADDEAALEREIEYVAPVYAVESTSESNTAAYELAFYSNADGVLTVSERSGAVVADGVSVKAFEKVRINTELKDGTTEYELTFTPDKTYVPGEYKKLSSYDKAVIYHRVSYSSAVFGDGQYIYVAPDGKGNGTYTSPASIYTAVKKAKPGQTIVLAGGKYNLSSTLVVERGHNGTKEAPINMVSNPKDSERAVLNFQGKCAGTIFAGDYWYFKGFDVTGSSNGTKGIQLSGSNNVLDDIKAYKNGNTGIQVARYLTTDKKDQWPCNNLILNCTSYLNADAGYEDADGFAAKLTIGEGNVFDGCIAAFNADDGWDLFAKAETGPIGKVVIKNSVTFMNGYVLNEKGELINAGNGNGFKMGGESLSGKHTLINSVAFANKAKGIDSNSCPDIQAYNSVSFDNESYNVAFYTNNAVNTAFVAANIVSFNVASKTAEQLKLKGTQKEADVKNSTNYYVGDENVSSNTEGVKVEADWFENLDKDAVVSEAIREILAGTFGNAGAGNGVGVERNEDGSVNMNGFLKLTDKAPKGAGAVICKDATVTLPDGTVTACASESKSFDDIAKKSYVASTPSGNTTGEQSSPNEKPSGNAASDINNSQADTASGVTTTQTPASETTSLATVENETIAASETVAAAEVKKENEAVAETSDSKQEEVKAEEPKAEDPKAEEPNTSESVEIKDAETPKVDKGVTAKKVTGVAAAVAAVMAIASGLFLFIKKKGLIK